MDELNAGQRAELLWLARRAVEMNLEGRGRVRTESGDPLLHQKRGVFVTIKVEGQLRGCIGYPLPSKSLAASVAELAVAAATQDFRFPPLDPEELGKAVLEISVLSLPVPVRDASEVEVGRHGIILTKGSKRGLLLPQVPLEWGWNRETYLRQGCRKAGLEDDAWKKGARIEVFTAEVFSEDPIPEGKG